MTYQRGDMTQSRLQLAMDRWTKNQTLKNAPVMDASIHSTQATLNDSQQGLLRSIVQPNVNSVNTHATSAVNKSECLLSHPHSKHCEFCHTVFTFKNPRAKYCCQTCRQDAYLVRKAFKDGIAEDYILALLSRNEAQNEA